MKKKIATLLILGCIVGLVWYLFIKPYDYLVTFKIKALPGTVNQVIKTWAKSSQNLINYNQKDIQNLEQQLNVGDSIHEYNFEIIPLNDSITKVKVHIKDKEYSLQNKISIPFSETNFEKNCVVKVKDLSKVLIDHLKSFKVQVVGKEDFKSKYCAYVELKGTQLEKAKGMMQNYSFLSSFLASKNVKLNGSPLVEITKWDVKTDSIYYNFCFPILKSDSLPQNPSIKYKELPFKQTIKAIYNGNYMSSDRGWYAIQQYAEKEDIKIDNKPIEIFYNNPGLSGNELEWKAEIFMPLKTKS